jgi:TfoX/Sxy family transcriptional regulator of competence genes
MWEENLERYDQFVAACPRFERKGKTMPYTSSNGHMFSLLNKAGQLGIRFSKEVQNSYMESLGTTLFKSYNAVMRGYILIPDELLDDQQRMVALLNESYDYVMTLEPK